MLFYSLHHLLSAMRESLTKERGCLDQLAGPLAALLLEDVLGATAAKKEVQKLQATLKEARSTKSFHTFALLAELISFPAPDWSGAEPFEGLMQPVVDMLQFARRKKEVGKLRQVLDRVLEGLCANTSAESASVLAYAYSLVAQNAVSSSDPSSSARQARFALSGKTLGVHAGTFSQVEAARRQALLTLKEETERGKFLVERTKREEYNQLEEEKDHFALNRVLLAELGLKLLLWQLRLAKKAAWAQDADRVARELGPFVSLCSVALEQESDVVAALGLECTRRLLRWVGQLPGLLAAAGGLAQRALVLLQQADPAAPLGREALLLLAAASKRLPADAWSLGQDEGRMLLRTVLQELDGLRDLSSAFSLLHGMLAKKMLCPEMYDIMERVGRLAITHQDMHIRQQCAASLVKVWREEFLFLFF